MKLMVGSFTSSGLPSRRSLHDGRGSRACAVMRPARTIASRANVLRMGFIGLVLVWIAAELAGHLFCAVLKLAGLVVDRRRCAVPSPSQSRAPIRASCNTQQSARVE